MEFRMSSVGVEPSNGGNACAHNNTMMLNDFRTLL